MQVYPKPVPQSPPAAAQPHKWLWHPRHGWGVLQIGTTVYVVHECHFDDDNCRRCFCVRLRKHDSEVEYQLCLNRDGDLACDCPDAIYRQRETECKHVHAVRDAYAQLDRDQRLADFIAGPDDPVANLTSAGWEAGLPATVSAATAQVDADSAALMKCPTCRKRGLTFTPMHRGTAYIGIAQCVRCGFAEQV